MPTSDREVFDRFLIDPDRSREEALLAYASYAAEKYDWIAHIEGRDNQTPDDAEVARWISDLSDARLRAIQEQAVAAFDVAARAYMEPVIEHETKEAVDASILGAVQRATSFRATVWPNLFIGIVASLAFSILVLLVAWVADRDLSPVGLWKHWQNPPAATREGRGG